MVEGGASRDEIHLVPPSERLWNRMDRWHKIVVVILGGVVAIFTSGIAFQQARGKIVLAAPQKAVDAVQDAQLRALQDTDLQMQVGMDHLHDEVRGMRTDLRYFDPRLRGGGLPSLPEETPRPSPTPVQDPSMWLPVPSPSPRVTP